MVKHMIIWTLRTELTVDEKVKIKDKIKTNLEGLKGQIPGLLDIKVIVDQLPTSNADLMLDSTFESVEALKVYATHPAHVEVADRDVRPFTEVRSCLDYEI